MAKKGFLLFLISSLFSCLYAQDEVLVIKNLVKATRKLKYYHITFERHHSLGYLSDTTVEVYDSKVHYSAKSFMTLHQIRNQNNQDRLVVSNPMAYMALYFKDSVYYSSYSSTYSRYDYLALQEGDLFMGLLRSKNYYRGFKLVSRNSNLIVLELVDSNRVKINDLPTIWKSVVKIDPKTYLPVSEEHWYNYGGESRYEKYLIIHIEKLNKASLKTFARQTDSFQRFIKQFRNGDSISAVRRESFKVLKQGDTVTLFRALVHGSKDSFDMSEYKDSIILLDFFYISCYPCTRSVPHLILVQNKYAGKGVGIFGVDIFSREWPRLDKYVYAYNVNYRILMADDSLSREYGVAAFPMLYLIKNGIVVKIYKGYVENLDKELEKELEALFRQ